MVQKTERGQRRRAKVDRKVTVTQITTRHNNGMQKTISKHTMHLTSKWIGYSSRRLLKKKKSKKYLIKCTLTVYTNV